MLIPFKDPMKFRKRDITSMKRPVNRQTQVNTAEALQTSHARNLHSSSANFSTQTTSAHARHERLRYRTISLTWKNSRTLRSASSAAGTEIGTDPFSCEMKLGTCSTPCIPASTSGIILILQQWIDYESEQRNTQRLSNLETSIAYIIEATIYISPSPQFFVALRLFVHQQQNY